MTPAAKSMAKIMMTLFLFISLSPFM